jgi:hypothetical protein
MRCRTLDGMDSQDITPAQAAAIGKIIGQHLRYLGKLQRRMNQVGFLPADPLFRDVAEAYDAIHKLNVSLHYLSCSSGVGRSPRKPE